MERTISYTCMFLSDVDQAFQAVENIYKATSKRFEILPLVNTFLSHVTKSFDKVAIVLTSDKRCLVS